MIYVFDQSLEGLLTAIFEWFERKPGAVRLCSTLHYQPDAFSETLFIHTDSEKAGRVWKGLQQRLSKEWLRKLYCCFLSEQEEAFVAFFNCCCILFKQQGAEQNYGDPFVLTVAKLARSVEREKHRMEAFIRFEKAEDGLFYCGIDPDFNVIPLIAGHFTQRYADQRWVIYDIKRNYGIYYDLRQTTEIFLENGLQLLQQKEKVQQDEKEKLYANLWKDYFKSTNIQSRKNTKLHVRHVPKRYWKYLTEKQPE